MQKIRGFESLAQLEPVDLAKRIALSEIDDLELPKSLASPSTGNIFKEEEEEENEADELLKLVKSNSLLITSGKVDNVLLEFFKEQQKGGNKRQGKDELLKEAEDWVNGKQELFLGWEVKDGKKLYLKDMEKSGGWRNLEEENQEVGLELEQEIFSSLVIELFDS